VRLTVSDTGDGISPQFLPYVFHRFRQEEGSISRKAGGLGLGLAVVRHLVELHGGTVSAESPGPQRGSTFTVDLPLALDRRGAGSGPQNGVAIENDGERAAENGSTITNDATNDANAPVVLDRRSGDLSSAANLGGVRTTDGSSSSNDLRTSARRGDGDSGDGRRAAGSDLDGNNDGDRGVVGSPQLADVRVLLVEDDDDSRNLLTLVLGRYGAKVIPAASAAEALDSFQQTTPDIIISDIGMVEGDGYMLLRKLRALPVQGSLLRPSADSSLVTHHSSLAAQSSNSSLITHNSSLPLFVPAIALTGYATIKDRERALSAGYQLHLAKPVEPEDLVAAIVNLIFPAD
jgi:CheY-like chemotaxis protein